MVNFLGYGQADLDRLRNSSWIALAVSLAGAIAGATFGIVGVLFGVAAGWIASAVYCVLLARPLVRASIEDGPSQEEA